MKCEKGDIARIIFSVRPENIGRIVKVKEYIGKYNVGENFQFRGMNCQCIVHDHHWWIQAEDLTTLLGPSPQAYIADSWLEPIRQPKSKQKTKKELDITI
jgi:hypothetical protein